MTGNALVLSDNIFFKKGMEHLLGYMSLGAGHKRNVFIDISFDSLMPDYTFSQEDTIFYITPRSYSRCLQSLFYDFIHRGAFIEANADIKKLKSSIFNAITGKSSPVHPARLTPMEVRVLCTLIDKGTNERCASALRISNKTVSTHKLNAMAKLGIEKLSHVIILVKKLNLHASFGLRV